VALQKDSRVDRRLGPIIFLRQIMVALWLAVSTPFYSIICIIGALVLRPLAVISEMAWHKQMLKVCGIRVITHGLDKLRKSDQYIFIGNHSSYFDIPVIVTATNRNVRFIAKRELFLIPFMGWGMAAVGHIQIDRSNAKKARESLTKAARAIRQRRISVVLFPEGTRSVDGTIGPFKQGSFTLAQEAGIAVVPVALVGMRRIMPKHSNVVAGGTVHVYIGDPLAPEVLALLDKKEIARKMRDEIVAMMDKAV
jgi:1-acyl-sn-glycerol-3-phosphate acyltransferase